MTTRRSTETERVAHWSCARMRELALSVQSPGPRTGTSATLKVGVSVPLSTPLDTTAPVGGAVCLALERVTSTYFVLLADVTGRFAGAVVFGEVVVVSVVVVIGESVDVVGADVG
jgi:hypothetical protein